MIIVHGRLIQWFHSNLFPIMLNLKIVILFLNILHNITQIRPNVVSVHIKSLFTKKINILSTK